MKVKTTYLEMLARPERVVRSSSMEIDPSVRITP